MMNNLFLDSLNFKDCERARGWRNDSLVALRTPFALTYEQQEDFYKNVICDRLSRNRFWAVRDNKNPGNFIAMVGLENIEWENGIAEISIIVNPELQRNGFGSEIIKLLFETGFNNLRLNNIYGECYECSPAYEFWRKLCRYYKIHTTLLPYRKFHKGRFHDSLYFSITAEKFNLFQGGKKK